MNGYTVHTAMYPRRPISDETWFLILVVRHQQSGSSSSWALDTARSWIRLRSSCSRLSLIWALALASGESVSSTWETRRASPSLARADCCPLLWTAWVSRWMERLLLADGIRDLGEGTLRRKDRRCDGKIQFSVQKNYARLSIAQN